MSTAKHVTYSGRVQGVGFRYTADRIAEEFGVNGYVRNLPTGEVELAAEGEAEIVDAFLAALAQRMTRYIEQNSVRDESVGGYKDFQIRH